MPTADDIAFMKAYARSGIRYWRHAAQQIQDRAFHLLGNRLAQDDRKAEAAIDSIVSGRQRTYFIPMPHPRPDIEYSFFMPITDDRGTSFDLLLYCRDDKWLGFRFEPADPRLTTHNYGHIQMNRRMERNGEIAVPGAPEWLPTSYPAFPLRTSEPVQMFLSMLTSIHGYPKFISDVLQKAPATARIKQEYQTILEEVMK